MTEIEKMRNCKLKFIFFAAGIRMQVPPQNILPAGCLMNEGLVRGRGAVGPQRGMMRRPVPSRGGQLEIAGVVVGQWGANYGQPGRMPQPLAPPHPAHAHPRAPPRMPPPQVGYRPFRPPMRYRCMFNLEANQSGLPLNGPGPTKNTDN